VLAGEVGVAEKAVDGFLAEGFEDGVLLEEVEALGLEVVGKRAVGDGVEGYMSLSQLKPGNVARSKSLCRIRSRELETTRADFGQAQLRRFSRR
jgi:hypothetical protein